MPEEAQRGLAYNASEDMREAWQRDGVPRRGQSGAMGSLWVNGTLRRENEDNDEEDDSDGHDDEADVRRGHQIYVGSSLRQRRRNPEEVALEASLHGDLVDENGELPEHRRNYQCAEPGLFSEHRYANPRDEDTGENDDSEDDGGRVYVVNNQGEHMPPCSGDDEYGCNDIADEVGAYDIESDSDGD